MEETNINLEPNAEQQVETQTTDDKNVIEEVIGMKDDIKTEEIVMVQAEEKQVLPSYFDGGLLQMIGWNLLGTLVTMVTLGICFPWAICMMLKWKARHTVINGQRLVFKGSAVGLFGHWIKWLLLSIITVGIYGLWIPIKILKWETKYTEFE